MEDISGTPPSLSDVQEAKGVVKKMIVTSIHKLPPELAVQMGNILRCLSELEKRYER